MIGQSTENWANKGGRAVGHVWHMQTWFLQGPAYCSLGEGWNSVVGPIQSRGCKELCRLPYKA